MKPRICVALLLVFGGDVLGDHWRPPFAPATVVQLFGWQFGDVAEECETHLKGLYGAVQVSPVQEHITEAADTWYRPYSPTGFRLGSAYGSGEDFAAMVARCNAAGVRVIADVAFNNLAQLGKVFGQGGVRSTNPHPDTAFFDNREGVEQFASSPFIISHFNDDKCARDISYPADFNSSDHSNLRNCRFEGHVDLDQGDYWVRHVIITFLNQLIDLGVAGFRIDRPEMMWPADLGYIFRSLHDLREDVFGASVTPWILNSLYDLGHYAYSADYTGLGRVTDYVYSQRLKDVFLRRSATLAQLRDPNRYYVPQDKSVVFASTVGTQRHPSTAPSWLKHRAEYERATALMLSDTKLGVVRVMSSFNFSATSDPPPTSKPCGSGSGAAGEWVCEHRWPSVRGMAQLRAVAGSFGPSNNLLAGLGDGDVLASVYGAEALFAANEGDVAWTAALEVPGLPDATYCDVLGGGVAPNGWQCQGGQVTAEASRASVLLPPRSMQAIHIGDLSKPVMCPTCKRTVIVFHYAVENGDKNAKIFLHGGIPSGINTGSNAKPIDIQHVTKTWATSDGEPNNYLALSQGDHQLSWDPNPEQDQDSSALGTPMTFANKDGPLASRFATVDKTYFVEFVMDCAQAYDGIDFQVKAIKDRSGNYEHLNYPPSCTGVGHGCSGSGVDACNYRSDLSSVNHPAKCGYVNTYNYGYDGTTGHPGRYCQWIPYDDFP